MSSFFLNGYPSNLPRAGGQVLVTERTPYPIVVIGHANDRVRNGRATVIGTIWIGSSITGHEVRYDADGTVACVPLSAARDENELGNVTLFPRRVALATAQPNRA